MCKPRNQNKTLILRSEPAENGDDRREKGNSSYVISGLKAIGDNSTGSKPRVGKIDDAPHHAGLRGVITCAMSANLAAPSNSSHCRQLLHIGSRTWRMFNTMLSSASRSKTFFFRTTKS